MQAAIADAQRAGRVDPDYSPEDVLSLVTAMALTWSATGLIYAASPDEPASDHDRRRRALAQAVRRAFVPEAEV